MYGDTYKMANNAPGWESGFDPEFGRYKITGRLEVADRHFKLKPGSETWNEAALANIKIPSAPQNNVDKNVTASGSGSIMMHAEVADSDPRVFLSGNPIQIVVKAFPYPLNALNFVDANVESHVSLKIRKLMDAHECPFFVLPFGVVTKVYNEKLKDITPTTGAPKSKGAVEKRILEVIEGNIAANEAAKKAAYKAGIKIPRSVYHFPMAIKYFVMEDVDESQVLSTWLQPKKIYKQLLKNTAGAAKDSRVMMKEIIAIFLQIMEALKTMAKHGITHNDLHWANIFVQRCNHSFVVDGVHIESKFIAKVFDWDRSVCDDKTCRDLRTEESFISVHKAHVHAYTPGYDLVGFF